MRLIRPSVILLCGPAACGKSTFAERHFRPTQIISSDWARARVCDDEKDQRFQSQAFDLVHHIVELRLSLNRLCVVDSTGLTSHVRKEYLELAKKFGVPCVALLFEVPIEKCVEHDQARQRVVGRPVIERQYQAFEQAKIDIPQEGFNEVIVLRDDDLDKVQIEIVFRPVTQPTAAHGRLAQGANRHTPRPRREYNGKAVAGPEVNTRPATTAAPIPAKPAAGGTESASPQAPVKPDGQNHA